MRLVLADRDDDAEDGRLMERARAGDARAFEALFHAHYGALCGAAMHLTGSRATAEELVQDVFADLWSRRATLAVPRSVRAWLLVVVRNRALNARRRESRERAWADRAGDDELRLLHAMPEPADRALEAREMRERVGAALAALPGRCRLAMHLRWREQMTHASIAEYMGISVKGVERLLSRGIVTLRQLVR